MSHLGDLTSVLADDEGGTWVDLPVDVRLRALAHVAGCPMCRSDVDEQRHVKARVRFAAGAPTLQAMPAGLLDSLLRLPASPQQPAGSSGPAQSFNPSALRQPSLGQPSSSQPSSSQPSSSQPAAHQPSRASLRGRYVAAAGIAASVVVGLGSGGSVLAGSAGGGAGPAGASPSASPAGTTGVGFAQTTPTGFGTAMAPVVRPGAKSAAAAVSVVYRRP